MSAGQAGLSNAADERAGPKIQWARLSWALKFRSMHGANLQFVELIVY